MRIKESPFSIVGASSPSLVVFALFLQKRDKKVGRPHHTNRNGRVLLL